MEQIGKLERRLEALEYYARLTEIEDNIKNLSISSDLDPTLDRYKFGFFVDNFTSTQYTAVDDPELSSSIYEYVLMPKKKTINLKFKFGIQNSLYTNGLDASFPWEE